MITLSVASYQASNVIETINRKRYHNAPASQTGPLGDPSTSPKARVTYTAHWHDGVGREIAMADYGTNGGTALVRSDAIPDRCDTVLVTTTTYDDAGDAFQTIDPSGKEDRTAFDAAARRIELIENYVDGNPATGGPDEDRKTAWKYTPDGQFETLTAINDHTGEQVTTFVYGTTLADSDVARSDLLRRVLYPDSTGESDSLLWRNMRRELLTRKELETQLRLHGVGSLDEVKEVRIESDGEVSVIWKQQAAEPDQPKPKRFPDIHR